MSCSRSVSLVSPIARGVLVSAVTTLGEKIAGVVSRGRENFKASTDLYDFIKLGNQNGVTDLYAASHAYSDCMKAVGVQTKVELEQLWGQHYSDPQVRDAVEALLEEEESFTEFLEEVEKELIPFEEKSVTNDPAAAGQELEERGCKVVMVTRGYTPSDAKEWRDINQFPYPLLLDPELKLFKELGLKRSVKKVWGVSSMVSYAEERLAGIAASRAYQGDDVHLMAGDYITDRSGKLVFSYHGANSQDRPSTDQLLGALETLQA